MPGKDWHRSSHGLYRLKVALDQREEPENFDRIRHILLPHDYLKFWLTGQLVAEYGDASGSASSMCARETGQRRYLTELMVDRAI